MSFQNYMIMKMKTQIINSTNEPYQMSTYKDLVDVVYLSSSECESQYSFTIFRIYANGRSPQVSAVFQQRLEA